jgi:hypothetical protein
MYEKPRPPVVTPSFITNRYESMRRQLPPHGEWLIRSLGMQDFSRKKNHASIWDKVD